MSVEDLAARRWAKNNSGDSFKPIDALREAIRQIESGELAEPEHIIIVLASKDEHGLQSDWLQAGSLDSIAQRGLLEGVKIAMFLAARL